MKISKLKIMLWVVLAGLAQGAAAAYPERPIRIIVPFAPGGNVDLTARAVTPGMAELLGRNIVVDNRGGAGGVVGAEIVAAAAPDGYTLLVGSTGLLTIAPVVNSKLRYNPVRDFAAISLISNVPLVMLVNPSYPAKTVKEFIANAKLRGTELTMASSGNFSTGQLAGALFQTVTGVRMIHVPYKGGSLAVLDLIGGRVDVMFDQFSSALGHVRGGKVRALAVTAAARSPQLPEVPTMREAGVKGVEAGTFTAILAPAGTPRDIVARLNEAVNKTLRTRFVSDSFAGYGAETIGATPAASKAFIQDEIAKWKKVMNAAGIKAEPQ